MSKSFEEVVGIYTNPSPSWKLFVNGQEFTKNLEYFEFQFSLNNPTKVSVKTGGVGLTEDIVQGNKLVIRKGQAEVFTGIVQQDDSSTGKQGMIKAADYSSELEENKDNQFKNSTVTDIVNFLIDGTEFEVGGTTKTFSTSFDLSATVNVEDFRVKRKQLEDLNRLMGEYGLEWYITLDGSDNPVLNVTDGLIITDSGSPLGTFSTSGAQQNARDISQNTNRNKGDYEAIVVRGYGDGDDQIIAKAKKRDINSADKTNDSFTVDGTVSGVSAGDSIIVESKGGILGGGAGGGNAGDYTVSTVTNDLNNDTATIEVNEDVTDNTGGLLGGGGGTLVYNTDTIGDVRSKIYTDKTIVSANEARKRARRLLSSRSTVWREVDVTPSTTDTIYGPGEVYKVEEIDAKLNDKFRVIESYYKIRLDQNESESELKLSNKPQSFYDDFRNEQDTTRSQTDHMQGARNVWGDKEVANATNAEPLTIDFEVPEDVVDLAGNNRLSRIEFNYACEAYRQTGNPQTITADNFDAGVKAVETSVNPGGTQIERENIKSHVHAVGSSTTNAATGRSFLTDSSEQAFNPSAPAVPSSGWSTALPSGGLTTTSDPENDIQHRITLQIEAIQDSGGNTVTRDLHYAILRSGKEVANFTYTPKNPATGQQVTFEDTSSNPDNQLDVAEYQWDFGDGSSTTTTDPTVTVNNTYSSSGTYTVTLSLFDSGGSLIDDVQKDIDVVSNLSLDTEKVRNGDLTPEEFEERHVSGNQITAQADSDVTVAFAEPDEFNVTQFVFDESNRTVTYDGAVSNTSSTSYNGFDVEVYLHKLDPSQFEGQEVNQAQTLIGTQSTGASINEPFSVDYTFDDDDYDSTFEGPGETYYRIRVLAQSDGEVLANSYFRGDSGRQQAHFTAEPVDYTNILSITDGNGNDATAGDNLTSGSITVDSEAIGSGRLEGVDLEIEDNQDQSTVTTKSLSDAVDDDLIELANGESITLTVDGQEIQIAHSVSSVNTATVDIAGTTEVIDQGEQFDINGLPAQMIKVIDDDTYNYEGIVFSSKLESSDNFTLSSGSYTAKLIAEHEDGGGTIDVLKTQNFTISLNDPPTADFSFSPTNPDAFETVNFTDQSTDPQGDGTITEWQWDFGDGTTDTITSSPGDTSHSYSSGGTYTVILTVVDDQGATDDIQKDVTVGASDALEDTVEFSGVKNVGGTPVNTQISTAEADTVELSGVADVGSQVSPAQDSVYLRETVDIPYRYISDEYEVYVATQGGGSIDTLSGVIRLDQINHEHDMPRQDDFGEADPDVGAGAEDKEVPMEKTTNNRGDVNLDFSTNNEPVVLDTTLSGNDVEITVANEDGSGNLTNTETISANNGTISTANSYQDDELYIEISSANNTDNFIVRDQSDDDSYTLAAIAPSNFQSDQTSQKQEDVGGTDGSQQDVVEDVSSKLLAGSTANNVEIFIDDDPDNSGTSSEQEITGDLYGGANDSGTNKDKGLDLSQYVDSPGWYRLKIQPDQASFIKSRVFLDHHKDTQ